MAICGDGATSNGRWHECLNVSAIWELPVIWVVNNNQFAYSTPNKLEFPVPTIAERADAYAMPGVRVDGATSNGRWHEAINTSAVHRLPVVWVVNNNQFAYSTPNPLEFTTPTIAERASAYDIPGVRVDGGNVLEVYEAARDAVERARSGGGTDRANA